MKAVARTILHNGLLLAVIGAVTAGLIAATWLGTRDDIAQAERVAEGRQLLDIFPEAVSVDALINARFELPANDPLLGLRQPRSGYRVANPQGEISGVILPATAADGYSGDIRLLVGIRRDGAVAGVRVVAHRETPGLGDKIDRRKSDWVLDFNGRSLRDPQPAQWTVRKDGGVFDQFTGATVTPRAVIAAVRRTLEYADTHRAQVFRSQDASSGPRVDVSESSRRPPPTQGKSQGESQDKSQDKSQGEPVSISVDTLSPGAKRASAL